MNQRPLRGRNFLVGAAVVLLCAAVGGIYGQRVTAQTVSEDVQIQQSLRSITKVLQAVEQNYADPVSTEKAIYNGAIPGMLRSLDPHSNFFDPRSFTALREEQRGRYYGVGMTV